MVHSSKNHSGWLVIPLFLALSFLGGSMPRGELWEILRSYQPFTSCRTNDRVNGIRERENIPPNSRIVAIWQLRWPECHVLHFESDRDNVNGSTRAELLGSYWPRAVWEGLNLGSIPNDHMPSQKDPKISIERRCSTILPLNCKEFKIYTRKLHYKYQIQKKGVFAHFFGTTSRYSCI